MAERSLTQRFSEYVLSDHALQDDECAFINCFTDWFAAATASRNDPVVAILASVAEKKEDGLLVIGLPDRFALEWAALLNGSASHAQDFDDIHLDLSLHLESPIFGAAYTVAQHTGAGWDELMQATYVGMQVMASISWGIMPEHYRAKWHSTSTMGTIGATAAAGRLLKLTPDQMANAWGIASSMVSGLQQNFGTMTKPLQAGTAARNGVLSALLAKNGFTGDPAALQNGMFEMLSPRVDYDEMEDHLLHDDAFRSLCFKSYPCGMPTHAGIINVGKIKTEHGLTAEDIDHIVIETTSHGKRMTGRAEPRCGLEGKFSIQFCAAASFILGTVDANTFTDDVLFRKDIQALMGKIELTVNDTLKEHSLGETTIVCKDRRTFSSRTTNIRRGKTVTEQNEQTKAKLKHIMELSYPDDLTLYEAIAGDRLPSMAFPDFCVTEHRIAQQHTQLTEREN